MRIDRRTLLQGAAATGIGAAIGGGSFVRSQVHAAGTMDTLKIAMSSLPPQLDPQRGFGVVSLRIYPMIFDTLIRRDWSQGGKTVPNLATAWTQVDEVTLEFALRDDVVFHDGTPFTATDVKYTFDRTLQNDATLSATGQFPIKEVVILDDHKVRFITTAPSGAFEFLLTGDGNAAIVPAAYFEKVGADAFQLAPVGTGPYKLTEYVPDSHLTFEVNDKYFGGVSAAKTVTIAGIPEVSTRIAALLNGEADLILDLPPDQVPNILQAGDFVSTSVAPNNVQVFAIVGTNAPMDKWEVRQAMSLGIDRQTIVEQLLLGNGVWPTGIQAKSDPLYTERPLIPYDPDQAKALLTQAGYAGEEIQFAFDSPDYYPMEQAWCEAIVGMWSDIGLNVKMIGVDVGQRVQITTESPYHLFTSSCGVIADNTLLPYFGDPSAYGEELFPAETFTELNALVAEGQVTVDSARRSEIYKQAFDIIEGIVPQINLFTINRVSAMKKTITWTETPDFGIDLRAGVFTVA